MLKPQEQCWNVRCEIALFNYQKKQQQKQNKNEIEFYTGSNILIVSTKISNINQPDMRGIN